MTIETKIAKNGNVIVSINGKNIAAAKAAQKALAAVARRYNSVLEIVNHYGDKYQLNTWEVNITCRDHNRAVKEICKRIRDFAHGKIKSNVEQAATNEEETTMTIETKTAAIEAEIKSVIAERTDAYDELEAAEANDEISQETIDRINEDIEGLSNQYWKLVGELEAAKAEPDDEPPTPETDGSEDDDAPEYVEPELGTTGGFPDIYEVTEYADNGCRKIYSTFDNLRDAFTFANASPFPADVMIIQGDSSYFICDDTGEYVTNNKKFSTAIHALIEQRDTDVFNLLPEIAELNDVDDDEPTDHDIVTYRDGKLDWVSSPKYGASFNPTTGQYVVHHFECGKTSGKIVHTDYTNDPEKFFAEMEKRGACSIGEPAQMTDATFEQLLDSRKPIDVLIKEDPQTREEYYAVEGQRLSDEQFAAAMIHDEYVEILNTVEFYREHHGLTLAQAEQIYIYNLDEDNIVEGHVDQMIAQFKAENNPDPDDEPPTPDTDEELLPDETRPATDNPAVVDENVRDVKFELDEANGIFRENFDGLRNEILAAFNGNADAKKYVLDVTAEMDELRDNIRKLEAALYHARRGEQFTIPNWRKIPADDCDEAEPVTEETILAVNETLAAINDAAPDGWEIFFDCDHFNFAIDYRDKPVTNIDSLALARILPADKFFARFLPLVDDRAHEDLQLKNLAAEVDSLQEMRGELQHDPERLAIIDELISEAKSEAGRILAS